MAIRKQLTTPHGFTVANAYHRVKDAKVKFIAAVVYTAEVIAAYKAAQKALG